MIDNRTFISSATLIPDIYNDYNIQSDDFVSRFPMWVADALEELKFIQAFITVEKDIKFDDHRCMLPWDFKGTIDVIINNKQAVLKNAAEFNRDGLRERVTTVPTFTPQPRVPNAEIATAGDNNVEHYSGMDNDGDVYHSANGPIQYNGDTYHDEAPYYYISNNWIHTNVANGTIHLRYWALPVIYDSTLNMDVPVIYNNGQLKKYLKLYVMKQILIRGYKHPVLSLDKNNVYTNPALELDKIRIPTRVSCNKFSSDRRENIATILRTLE